MSDADIPDEWVEINRGYEKHTSEYQIIIEYIDDEVFCAALFEGENDVAYEKTGVEEPSELCQTIAERDPGKEEIIPLLEEFEFVFVE